MLLYFPRLLADGDVPTLLLRSVLTVLMHAVASGILGYFYGLAHFSAEEVGSGHGGRGPAYRLLHRVFLFRRERLYHEAKMFEGLVLAGAYHATFNLAASQGRVSIMLVLVAGGCAFLYYLLGLKIQPRENRGDFGAACPRDVCRQAQEAFDLEDLERQHPLVVELAAVLEAGRVAERQGHVQAVEHREFQVHLRAGVVDGASLRSRRAGLADSAPTNRAGRAQPRKNPGEPTSSNRSRRQVELQHALAEARGRRARRYRNPGSCRSPDSA